MWKSTIEGQKLYCSCYYYPQNYKYRSDTKYRILTTHPLISSSIACVWNGFLLFFVPHFWQNCCFLRLMRSVANSLEHTTQQYRELSSTKTRSRAKRMMTNATKYYFHPRFSLCTIDKNTNHIQKKKEEKGKKRESYSLQLTRSQLPGRRDKQLVDNVWNLQADQMQWSTVWKTCKLPFCWPF